MKPIWGLALLSQLATAYRGGDVLHESFKGKGFFLQKQGGVNMGPILGIWGILTQERSRNFVYLDRMWTRNDSRLGKYGKRDQKGTIFNLRGR